jgi:hypothetical protein
MISSEVFWDNPDRAADEMDETSDQGVRSFGGSVSGDVEHLVCFGGSGDLLVPAGGGFQFGREQSEKTFALERRGVTRSDACRRYLRAGW